MLGAQKGLDSHRDEALRVMRVNFVGCGSLVLACMRALRSAGGGTLVVLSSVVAERPRSGNAIYGAAKAGLDALSQGLADAAHGDVRVLVVRPGFVRTRMTVGLSAAPFATSPEAVAEDAASGLASSAPHRLGAGYAALCVLDSAPTSAADLSQAAAVRRRELRGALLVATSVVILLLVLSPGTAFVGAVALLRAAGIRRPPRLDR